MINIGNNILSITVYVNLSNASLGNISPGDAIITVVLIVLDMLLNQPIHHPFQSKMKGNFTTDS
jgi:hypothetical protein